MKYNLNSNLILRVLLIHLSKLDPFINKLPALSEVLDFSSQPPQEKFEANRSRGFRVMIGQPNIQTDKQRLHFEYIDTLAGMVLNSLSQATQYNSSTRFSNSSSSKLKTLF